MTLKVNDRVCVRFDLSKIGGMKEYVEKRKKENNPVSDSYPIAYAHGTVVRKSFWYPCSREKLPIAVVKFDGNQVLCDALNISNETMAIDTSDRPDYYGAKIMDENNNPYIEKN